MLRTHTCGELDKKDLNQEVELAGWVDSYRNLGGLMFVDLRDQYGMTQLRFDPDRGDVWQIAEKLRHEWTVRIKGVVMARPDNMVNEAMATGAVEVEVKEIEVLSQSRTLPFDITNEEQIDQVKEALRLEYRYLDLRRPKLQQMLRTKAEFISHIRGYFEKRGFLEVQTPILANSSPEGARDFLVPTSQYPGKFFALPQAPQQFKQLLMVGGVDKYFQIAPCFRDEDTRVDRHYGEFYQLDMEMAFAEQSDVFAVMDPLMIELTDKFSDKKVINLADDKSIIKIPWLEAMNYYGTDKPDLRFEMKIQPVSDEFKDTEFKVFASALEQGGVIHALKADGQAGMTRKQIDELEEIAKKRGAKGLAYIAKTGDGYKSPIAKFFSEEFLDSFMAKVGAGEGDMVFLGAGDWRTVCWSLGAVRSELGRRLELADPRAAAWCWVVDYPMYEPVEEGSPDYGKKEIDFGHNPFSMPQGGMAALENEEPLNILAWQYDLVLNGFEISSGAVRNMNPDLMYKAFAIAGYGKELVDKKFGAMIKAFSYGAPPHAGNAPGIDRLLMVFKDWESIRDIYAFPKDGQGRDLLMQSPSEPEEGALKELGLSVKKDKDES